MSSTTIKAIKRRIKSAKNIHQITKAMEMVSASKMRRAQKKALTTRPYSTKLKEILSQLASQVDTEKHKMFQVQKQARGTIGIILVSSDRGLCGALNTNLFRTTEEFKSQLEKDRTQEVVSYEFISLGRKAREYVLKTGQNLHAEFTDLAEKPKFDDALPISRLAIEGFQTGKFTEIYLVYTAFISTLNQEVNSLRLLPIEKHKLQEISLESRTNAKEYIFEPSAKKVLDSLLPHYIEMQVYQTILEALASEHSARMVSMRNASDNAKEIIADLTLIYNNKRQQAITSEISDLTTSRLAVV